MSGGGSRLRSMVWYGIAAALAGLWLLGALKVVANLIG
jgi:hypothetical protein